MPEMSLENLLRYVWFTSSEYPFNLCICLGLKVGLVPKAWFILLRKVLYVGYGEPSPSPESLSVVSGYLLSVRHSVEGRRRRQGL